MKIEKKVLITSPGGTAEKNSFRYTLYLPKEHAEQIGLTEKERDVEIECTGNQIIITKKER